MVTKARVTELGQKQTLAMHLQPSAPGWACVVLCLHTRHELGRAGPGRWAGAPGSRCGSLGPVLTALWDPAPRAGRRQPLGGKDSSA